MSQAHVFQRKGGCPVAQSAYERLRDVVAAIATISVAAADHEKSGRVIDDDVPHVARFGQEGLPPAFFHVEP